MKQSIIDIGSNSIRLTVYSLEEDQSFRILFKEKNMAGLAGYINRKKLSEEGILRACCALLEFRNTLDLLHLHRVSVFATASLRNISNREEALGRMEEVSGFSIEILDGNMEALLGYAGAMEDLHLESGIFTDIGGGSTELVSFEQGEVQNSASFDVGSLSLYRRCVRNILPGKASLERIREVLEEEIDEKQFPKEKHSPLIGVGGSCRAVMNLGREFFSLPASCKSLSQEQFQELAGFLCLGKEKRADFILKTEAERIHTLIPGMMILQHLMEHFDSDELIVSGYGVREGFLCQRILKRSTLTHKIAN